MLVLFGSETPMPTPSMTVDPDLVTPGPAGFAIMVVILIAVVLLIWDMNRRIRRVRYREEVRDELDAELAAASEGPAGADAPAETVAPTEPDDDGDAKR